MLNKFNYFIFKKFNFLNKYIFLKIINKNLNKNLIINVFVINLFKIYYLNKIYKKKKKITNILIFSKNILKNIYICNLIIFIEKIFKIKNYKNFYLFNVNHLLLHSQKFNHKDLKNYFIINLFKPI